MVSVVFFNCFIVYRVNNNCCMFVYICVILVKMEVIKFSFEVISNVIIEIRCCLIIKVYKIVE